MVQFSIVIPTLNRCELLGKALRSAIEQEGPTHEVVVSNNSSTDGTEQLLGAEASPALRVVKTERQLSMVDHFEFALGHAHGDWILFLCDDDALVPGALAHLSQVIENRPDAEILRFRKATYCYDDGGEERGNFIRYRRAHANRVREVDTESMLRGVLSKFQSSMPRYLNCAVKRSLVEGIRAKHGRAFGEWAPDASGGILLLSERPVMLELGRIMMLWGKNLQSYGPGALINPQHYLGFLKQFACFEGGFSHTPYPELITVTNGTLDTIERTRLKLGERERSMEMDLVPYLKGMIEDAERYVSHGHDSYRDAIQVLRKDLNGRMKKSQRWREWRKGIQKRIKKFARSKVQGLQKELIIESPWGGHDFHDIYQAAQVFAKVSDI